jgi:uncharacterized protein (TIGR03083 family)
VTARPDLGPPIDVRAMFDPERDRLLATLETLDAGGWREPTACPGWSVQDVAAHILGDDLGRLARTRDGATGREQSPGESLPHFVDRINQEWVVAARRLSSRLLVSSLAWTREEITDLWRSLPPEQLGEPVSWAGPAPAPVWLDAARDLTEYWVHRQQIREAVGVDDLEDPATLHIVLDTFLRALPHTLRHEARPTGTRFTFGVSGPAGGAWTVEHRDGGWGFVDADPKSPDRVLLDAELTWRLCVRMVPPAQAARHAEIHGDEELARAALGILAIIWSG